MSKSAVSLLILFVICLVQPTSTLTNLYKTQLVFYHQQVFPADYYWMLMQIQYSGDKDERNLEQLIKDIKVLKEIVDEYNSNNLPQQSNNSSITQQVINNDSKNEFKLIVDNEQETQAFSNKIVQLSQNINQFKLTLSSMNIHMDNSYSIIHQDVYLRAPKHKRQQLAQFADRIQSQFNGSKSFRVLSIETGNPNSYSMISAENRSQLYEKNVNELIDEKQLTTAINEQASRYCQSLEMQLSEVISFHPLMDQGLYNNNINNGIFTQQQSQPSIQLREQMTYDQAYFIAYDRQFDDYENVFYQVKVICHGEHKPQHTTTQIKDKKIKGLNKRHSNKMNKKDKIQKELNKLNKILQTQRNN